MNGSRVYLRDYSQCSTLQGLIAAEERTIGWLTALKKRTNDPIQLKNIQEGLDAANSILDGLLNAQAAAGCNEVPANYTGNWMYVITGELWTDQGVNVYPLGPTGDVQPVRTIGGAQTGLSSPAGLALDSTSYLFVANMLSNAIMIYPPAPPGAAGNVPPVRMITGPLTGLSNPGPLAMDRLDNLYVLNIGPSVLSPATVTVYAPGSYGNAPPSRAGQGVSTYYDIRFGQEIIPDIAVDGDGNLYVAHQYEYDAVTVHAPDGTQTRAITGLAAATGQPGSGFPTSLALDADGSLYVLEWVESAAIFDDIYVLVYPPGADAPSAVLLTGLQADYAEIAIDRSANIYVASGVYDPPGTITRWAAGSTGNAPPSGTITGPLTELNLPSALLIYDPDVQTPWITPGPIGGGG